MRDLPIYSDFEPEVKITRKNATTGATEAATGLASGMTARISLTKTGAAIGALTVSLTERGTTGIYAGVLDTAALVTALGALIGQTVYVIYARTGDIDREWSDYVVRDNKKVG
jgi:hypothetical protein